MRKQLKKVFSVALATALAVTSFAFSPVETKAATAAFASVGGWTESIYAQVSGVSDADVTAVSYSGAMNGSLTGDDLKYLVRDFNGGVRIDIPGLKAGNYTLTVTTKSGTLTQAGIAVENYDRSGYAHWNYTEGVGAYNDDGTLKAGAIVLYVTEATKETVTVKAKDGTTVTGIGNILNSVGQDNGVKGDGLCELVRKDKKVTGKANTNEDIIRKLAKEGTPLVVRIVGQVSAPEGLTQFDGYDYGGSVGDNGSMARMQSGKDVTIEGIGTDAIVDGWGFHFMCNTSDPDLAKNFEVRNIEFMNVPEDCIGMEGVQEGGAITAPVERCWVHNCTFNVPHIANPAESDKSEGDGACDFKRGNYFTNSYCYYKGYHKTNLIGSSNDSLQYNVTMHHNIWENVESRAPMTRNSNIHVYNNFYYNQTSYCMDARMPAYIYSEYNMFYMVKNPMEETSGGSIKSYKDSFATYTGSLVCDIADDNRNLQVTTGNKYENFDTNPAYSYIPSGDYLLQTDVTEARKYIYAYTGTMKENPIKPDQVTMDMLSLVPSNVTPEKITLPYSSTTAKKVSKTVYAFTVNQEFDITVNYAIDTLDKSGVLVNEAGEEILTASGTATNLPAGTYMIQATNFTPGKTSSSGVYTPPAFKEFTINSISITASDPNAHVHRYSEKITKAATCTEEGTKTFTCTSTNGTCDRPSYTETISKTSHTYGSWTVDKEATATEAGSKHRECSVCKAVETVEIPVGGSSTDPVNPSDPGKEITYGDYAQVTIPENGFVTGTDYGKADVVSITVMENMSAKSSDVEGYDHYYQGSSNPSLTNNIPTKGAVFTLTATKNVKVKFVVRDGGAKTWNVKDSKGTTVKTGSLPALPEGVTATAETIEFEIPAGEMYYFYVAGSKVMVLDVAVAEEKEQEEEPVTPAKNGLLYVDGVWAYYVDDVVDTTKTALVEFNGAKWYIKNGYLNKNYSGLVYSDGAWYYVSNGKYDTAFVGIVELNGAKWYVKDGTICRTSGYYNNGTDIYAVKDGKIDTTVTNLLYVNGVWYYFRAGVVDWTYSSLAYANETWWYVKNGVLDKTYSGLVPFRNQMWYVTSGKLNKTFVGTCEYEGATYDVKNGIGTKRTGYTGLSYTNGSWVYLTNGVVDTDYRGVATANGSIWFVENGTLSSRNGVWTQDGEIYWIVEGKVDSSVYDLKYTNGKWYYFRAGVVDWTYNDLAYANNAWWYVKNGELDKTFTGLYLFRNQLWYINAGKLDKSFTGTTTYNGKTYTVSNGVGTVIE